MKLNKDFILRNIVGDYVLVPTGRTAAEFKGLFPITQTGAFIFERIEKINSAEDAAKLLLDEYDVDFETALKDSEEFLASLRRYGIIGD